MHGGDFSNALAPETRIGQLVITRAIGQGAWGIVYAGHHDVWGDVAVKEYFPSAYASRQSHGSVASSAPQWQDAVRRGLDRFVQEGQALKAIRHENVVAVHEFVEYKGGAMLLMEYVEGETLARAYAAGKFHDPPSIVALATTLVDTLRSIHGRNIMHRDIAPDNIMIRTDGRPVLIDFGGAAAAIASATRSTHNIVKDGFSPPEQYDVSDNPTFPIGPWSDIYATAAVLYRLAADVEPAVSNVRLLAAGSRSGQDPLRPLTTLAPAGFSKAWLLAVDRGLALLPRDRPQTANEWRTAFEEPAIIKRLSPATIGGIGAGLLAVAASAAFFVVPNVLHLGANPQRTAFASASKHPIPANTPGPRTTAQPIPLTPTPAGGSATKPPVAALAPKTSTMPTAVAAALPPVPVPSKIVTPASLASMPTPSPVVTASLKASTPTPVATAAPIATAAPVATALPTVTAPLKIVTPAPVVTAHPTVALLGTWNSQFDTPVTSEKITSSVNIRDLKPCRWDGCIAGDFPLENGSFTAKYVDAARTHVVGWWDSHGKGSCANAGLFGGHSYGRLDLVLIDADVNGTWTNCDDDPSSPSTGGESYHWHLSR